MSACRTVLLLFLFTMFFSCRQHTSAPGGHAFYYWKTIYTQDKSSSEELKKLGVGHIYLRLFDVDWNDRLNIPAPKGELLLSTPFPVQDVAYTPVVFITSRTFQHMSNSGCDTLAANVQRKINVLCHRIQAQYVDAYYDSLKLKYKTPIKDSIAQKVAASIAANNELQIDCDWTAATKDRYFYFLKRLKQLYPDKVISATIRLYPYRYSTKAGVPPVDRGMLMCYNMGSITDAGTNNSVFDIKVLGQYLNAPAYPLPLDVALPAFGWYVWFRGGHYKGILHGHDDLEASQLLVKQQNNSYRVVADTALNDNYLREGDILRREYPDAQALQLAAAMITKKVPGYRRITFFDWDYSTVLKYENTIQDIYSHY